MGTMHRPLVGLTLLVAPLSACGGGGAAGGTTNPPPSVFTSLVVAPRDATVPLGGAFQLTATPLDQRGVAMAGLPAPTFAARNGAIAQVDAGGMVSGVAAGSATVVASLTHDGVTHSDSAAVTVLAPSAGRVTVTTPNRTFSPALVTITPGDTVTWLFSEAVHNVTFTGAAPPGGNIGDTNPGNAVDRVFPTAGTFDYDCTRHAGMSGRVVVQAGSGGGTYSALAITPASAAMAVGDSVLLVATPLDENGAPLAGLPAATFTSSAPDTVSVTAAGAAAGLVAGTATITASLTHQGQTHTAAAAVTVVPPGTATATITTPGTTFTPERVTLPPGAVVTWEFSGLTHNVTFKDVAPPGGNIPDTAPGTSVSRAFPDPGSYDYECTLHAGMKGRIIVR